jgi:hypothetical protein
MQGLRTIPTASVFWSGVATLQSAPPHPDFVKNTRLREKPEQFQFSLGDVQSAEPGKFQHPNAIVFAPAAVLPTARDHRTYRTSTSSRQIKFGLLVW